MKWSDGQKVTAADFCLCLAAAGGSGHRLAHAALLDMVAGYRQVRSSGDVSKLQVSAPEENTFVVTLSNRCAYFLKAPCVRAAATMPVRSEQPKDWQADPHGPVYQRGLPHQRMEERSADRHGTGELLRPAATANEHAGVPVRDGCGDEDGAAEKRTRWISYWACPKRSWRMSRRHGHRTAILR